MSAPRFSRRTFALGVTVGAIPGVLGTLAGTRLAGRDAAALEPGELKILSSRDESTDGQRQTLIEQWNKTHPNQAEIIVLPPRADDAHSQMVASAQSGELDVDIFNLDVTWTAEFADADFIRPLDESTVDRKEFLARPIETCVYKDTLWALPFNTDAGLLYYRSDLIQQPPATWPLLKATAEQILAKPPEQRPQAGYTGQLANYEGLTVNALEAIQDAAGRDVVREGKVAVKLDDIEEGISRLRPGSGVVLRDSLNNDEEQSTQAFRDGEVLFMRNWPVAHRKLAPPTGEKIANNTVQFDVTTLPGGSVLGGQNLAIAARTTKPKAAQALIEFLTGARSQQILFERGGLAATRKIVYYDGEVGKRYKYVDTLRRAIDNARPRPVTPCYAEFSQAFHTAIHQALRTKQPLPADFIETLNTALNC